MGDDPWADDGDDGWGDEPKPKPKGKKEKEKPAAKSKKKEEDDGWGDDEPPKKGSKKESQKGKEKEKKPSKKKKDDPWDDDDGGGGGGGGGGGDWGDSGGGGQDDEWENPGDGGDGGVCEFCEGRGCSQCKGTGDDIDLKDQLANALYEADEEKSNPKQTKSLDLYKKVLEIGKGQKLDDTCHGIIFKALQRIVEINLSLKKDKDAITAYNDLLSYLPNVSPAEGEEAVDNTITLKILEKNDKLKDEIYGITATKLEKMPDKQKTLFHFQMKQTQDYLNKGRFKEAQKLLDIIHNRCRLPDGNDDQKNHGTELFDIYALELSIASKTKNLLKTKELYERTKNLTGLKNPKSQSIIRECWGKMFGNEGNWQRAYKEFYEAFTNYQEASDSDSAKRCLKYVVVANMLAKGEHNPFSAPEARVYQNDPDITPIINLRAAYDKREVEAFGKCLEAFNRTADEYIKSHMTSTVEEFQRLAALKLLKSYRRIRISELASKLQVSEEKTEELLIQLILDSRLSGRIDQIKGVLDLSQRGGGGDGDKYNALDLWTSVLDSADKGMPQPSAGRGGGMGGFHPMMMGW